MKQAAWVTFPVEPIRFLLPHAKPLIRNDSSAELSLSVADYLK